MGLQGQLSSARPPGEFHGERGYAMAALLVSLAIMSVLMAAVLPAWRHQAQREKEAELVFRGEQYVRAIRLWERKMGPGSRPPTFDIMVQQKFLRKKYKDPMTADGEFQPLFAGSNLAAPGGQPQGRGGIGQPPGRGGIQPSLPQQSGIATQMGGGGILGVASKSKEASIRIYRGGAHYNEWQFIYASASNTPGGRGAPMPGGRGAPVPGGRGFEPGGRGTGPFGPGGRRGIGPDSRGGFPQGPFPPRGGGR